jgi:hypothetical protein
MVVSNIAKYTIKHVKDSGNPVEIPVYPSSIVPSHNLISKSWNNMYGQFQDVPVNIKLKINWVFDAISESDLEQLYNNLIYNKILTYKSRFFEINTYFPGVGFISGTFYLGTPTNFKSLGTHSNDGSVKWFSLELHWIEVDGIKLLDPSNSVSQ